MAGALGSAPREFPEARAHARPLHTHSGRSDRAASARPWEQRAAPRLRGRLHHAGRRQLGVGRNILPEKFTLWLEVNCAHGAPQPQPQCGEGVPTTFACSIEPRVPWGCTEGCVYISKWQICLLVHPGSVPRTCVTGWESNRECDTPPVQVASQFQGGAVTAPGQQLGTGRRVGPPAKPLLRQVVPRP